MFKKREKGQSAVEFALVVALVGIAEIASAKGRRRSRCGHVCIPFGSLLRLRPVHQHDRARIVASGTPWGLPAVPQRNNSRQKSMRQLGKRIFSQ